MKIRAIISSQDRTSLSENDISDLFVREYAKDDSKKLHLSGQIYNTLPISEKIKRLAEIRAGVPPGNNLYVSFITENPQAFYRALSEAGYTLVDSRISMEKSEFEGSRK